MVPRGGRSRLQPKPGSEQATVTLGVGQAEARPGIQPVSSPHLARPMKLALLQHC